MHREHLAGSREILSRKDRHFSSNKIILAAHPVRVILACRKLIKLLKFKVHETLCEGYKYKKD